MMENKFDNLLSKAIKEDMDTITPPPAGQVWAYIAQRLKEDDKKVKRLRHKKQLAAVITLAIVSSGAAFIIKPDGATAIGKKITSIFLKTNNESISVDTVVKDNSPEEQDNKILSLEEAKRRLPPPFRIIESLPHNYKLKEIMLLHQGTFTAEVMFKYKNNSNELMIIQRNIVGEAAFSDNYPPEDKITEVKIKETIGILVEHSLGGVTLTFNKDNIHYQFNGEHLSSKEIMNIASVF